MRKNEIIVDVNSNSCGACAIWSVVRHYGGYVPLIKIKEDTYTDLKGTNALNLVCALQKYGFEAEGRRVLSSEINSYSLPIIAHTSKNGFDHFVVVYEIDARKVLLMDSSIGKVEMSLEKFKSIYTGFILTMRPKGKIIKMEQSHTLIKLCTNFIKSEKKIIFSLFLLCIFITVLSIVPNLYIKIGATMLNKWSIVLLFSSILLNVFFLEQKNFLESKMFSLLKRKLDYFVISHIFTLPIRILRNKRVGEIVKTIEDLEQFESLFLKLIVIVPLNILILSFSFFWVLKIAPNLVFMILIFLAFEISISILSYKKNYFMEKEVLNQTHEYFGFLTEYIKGIESIKNLSVENFILKKVQKEIENYSDKHKSLYRYTNSIKNIKIFISELCFLIVCALGLNSIFNGQMSMADLVTFISLYNLITSICSSFIELVPEILHNKAIMSSLSEFLDVQKEKSEEVRKETINSITFKNVTFTYNYCYNVLENFNYSILKGDKVLLRGPSGSGKSTLVKMLSGHIDDYKGEILLNEKDLKSIKNNIFRDSIIYIGQEETLFSTSIYENITLGIDNAKLYQEVLKIAQVEQIILNSSNKDLTPLYEGGINLSGGERARIILARALFRRPEVLIIDETLSNVPVSLEDEIIDSLLKVEDLTLIYITHRDKRKLFNKIIDLRKDDNIHGTR